MMPVATSFLPQGLGARVVIQWLICLTSMLGCSTPHSTTPECTELVLWHAYENGGVEHAFLTQSLARYQAEHPTVSVRAVSVPFEPFANKINVSVPRGNGPDVFIFAHDAVGDWAAKKIVEPLGPWVDAAWLDDIQPSALDAFVYRRELYGIPNTAKTLGLYYRPEVIKIPAQSTRVLKRQVLEFRQRNPGGVGLAYDVDDLFFHAPWLLGFGGRLLDDDALIFDRKPYVDGLIGSLEFVKTWVDEGIVPADTNYDSVKAKFQRGEVAYVMSGPWFATGLAPESFRVTPLPFISEANDAPARPFMTVEGLYLSRYSSQKFEALNLIRFLTSSRESNRRKEVVGDVLTRLDLGPATTSSMTAFEAQLKTAIPTPNDPKMKAMWTPLNRVLSEVVKRKMPPQDAIDEARLLLDRAGGVE